MNVTLHPAAAKDIQEAAEFYEREGSTALAARFVSEFRKVAVLLSEQPDIGSPRTSGKRGLCMNVIPYTVIYSAGADGDKILVVKHDRKRPSFGASRS